MSKHVNVNDTDIDADHFRARLETRKMELEDLRQISSDSRNPVALDQSSVGRVSRIDAMQAQQMALATERNREREISQISAALARLDDGEFGYCISCGEPIAAKRLELNPAVPTCINCAK